MSPLTPPQVVFVLFIGAAVGFSACGGGGAGGGAQYPLSGPRPAPPPPPPNATAVIEMRSGSACGQTLSCFVAPGGSTNSDIEVTINLGETVGWHTRSSLTHTATSTDEPAGGNSFHRTLQNEESFVFMPNVRGTWTFRCEIHPAVMRDARIIVQ